MKYPVVSIEIDAVTLSSARSRIVEWAQRRKSKYVCVANVHMVMEAFDSESYRIVVNSSDLVVPDGRPLIWLMRALGSASQTQVRGANLMSALCAEASKKGVAIGLFGGTENISAQLKDRLETNFSGINISYQYSPPFRDLSGDEKAKILSDIRHSGTQILFVALGCPKQEKWMFENRDQLTLVMVGVGAAFNIHAGAIMECPLWLQAVGLEWAFRLWKEPRRLWKRYLKHNPRFVILSLFQFLRLKNARFY